MRGRVGAAAWVVAVGIAGQVSGQEVSEHRPVFTPDGSFVVYMRQDETTAGDWELFVTTRDGTGARRMTHHVGWDGYAVPSPDGQRVVLDRSANATGEAKQPHLLELESLEVRPLGTFEGWVSVSDWSEEHGLLAFWEREGQRDLYLLDTEGAVTRRLTDTPSSSEHDAHFSPDGAHIVFASGPADGEGRTTLEIMDASGEGRRVLIESVGRIYGADWSTDGTRIAYTDAPDGDNGDVYVVDLTTTEVTRVTSDPAWDHMPVWDVLDPSRLLFTSYRSGSERMYHVDLSSGSVTPWMVAGPH